jgi:hypothetical protein
MPDAIEPSGERGYPRDVESRLRVLEEIAAATKEALSEGRAEARALRGEMNARLAALEAEIDAMDERRERDFRILFGTIITTTLGLAWLIAHSAHWL